MFIHERRLISTLSRLVALSSTSLFLAAAVANAGDTKSSSDITIEVVPPSQPAPVPTPPPGMSITPWAPMMAPAPADGQVPGCPVKDLKPLDLLV